MNTQPTNYLRRALLGGLAALSVAAGGSLALTPHQAHAFPGETSSLLYTRYFRAGDYLRGAQLQQECLGSAASFGVDHTEAVLRPGGYESMMRCYGYTNTILPPAGGGVLGF